MKHKSILFDLDGTLTDSCEGITKCAALALDHFGLPYKGIDDLKVFIGPPLRMTFPKFGVAGEDVEEAVSIFRQRYTTVGKFENKPYSGIEILLQRLRSQGFKLYVATAKPETLAAEILEHFHLTHYFERICGASLDGTRDSKSSIIACLLSQITPGDEMVMVGDTAFDVEGALQHHIPSIGVAWGYGAVKDMRNAGAAAIAENMDELFELIDKKTWNAI